MEQIANLHIEKLSEGVYLATSEDILGLTAQEKNYIFFATTIKLPPNTLGNK